MEGYQEVPPEGLWDAVQAGVSRPKIIWWPWVTGALAAAAAVVLAVFLWKPEAPSMGYPQLLDVPEELVADLPHTEIPVAPYRPERIAETATSKPSEPVLRPSETTLTPTEPVVAVTEPETAVTEPNVPVTKPETAVTEPDVPVTEPETVITEPEEPVSWPEDNVTVKKKTKSAHVGKLTLTSGGNLLAQSTTGVSKGYGVPSHPGLPSNTPAVKSTISPAMLSRNRASTTEETHQQEFRFSLGVAYRFAPRWSVGTGISYTALQSDYCTVSGSTETRTTRYSHYLGVPLNVQFHLVEWEQFSLYLSAGPMLETLTDAKSEMNGYVGGRRATSNREKLSLNDLRWSLNAGAGAAWQFSRNCALFVQPGLSWHLPSGSEIENIYTTHPLAFNLDLGFRWYLN